MARVRVLSDLHFEFHRDRGASFVESLGPPECDLLVVAGDLCDFPLIGRSLDMLCGAFSRIPVAYVMGNHEPYGGSAEAAEAAVRAAAARNGNLLWLDGGTASAAGLRLAGATLWFRHSGEVEPLDRQMNDFSQIRGLRQFVPEKSRRDERLLRSAVESAAPDVVVTHYLPHPASVAPRWRGSSINRYFLQPGLQDLVESGTVPLWIHGHTHDSVDERSGVTVGGVGFVSRILCNPFGYAGHEENPSFDPSLFVDVEPRAEPPIG